MGTIVLTTKNIALIIAIHTEYQIIIFLAAPIFITI